MSARTLRNVSSGLVAQIWTGGLGLLALPIVARGLGAERYGLLALNLALINFAAVADLGVGRAASKYLAEDFERQEGIRAEAFVQTALSVTLVMGLLGALTLVATTPLFVRYVFRIPAELRTEAVVAFWITSSGLPAVLLRILFDGVIASQHRIAILSLGNVAASTLRLGLTVAAVLIRHSLLGVLLANVIVTYLHAAGLGWYTARCLGRPLRIAVGWNGSLARQLLGLGLGATLSWILANVVFLYADRFLIAAFLPLALAGYYTLAFDITSRQAYVSNSVVQAYFPIFSGHSVVSGRLLEGSYIQAAKAVAVGATGIAMLFIVLARELLTFWVGPTYAQFGSVPLMLLALTSLLSCYSSVPYTLIIAGAAQPRICVRVFTLAVALHVTASFFLLQRWSISGVAAAFGLAYGYAFVHLYLWVSRNVVRIPLSRMFRKCFSIPITAATLTGALLYYCARPLVHSLFGVGLAFAGGYLTYFALCVAFAYDRSERTGALSVLTSGVWTTLRELPERVIAEP